MKYSILIALFLFSILSFSQTNSLKISHDSTYAGPRLGEGAKKFVGNLRGKSEANFSNLWNQVTPENCGKWEKIGISPDTTTWDWKQVTELYNYAKANKMQFKFHTLVWGRQQPKWISELSPDEQLKYITYWTQQVGKRFPDAEMVDVVNESLYHHWPPDGRKETVNYMNALGGKGKTGYDWVIKSFELARKFIPKSKLILNDYSIINSDSSTTAYIEIIQLLKARKLIDGIGIQAHRGELNGKPVAYLKNNIDRLASTGIPIYFTEIDLGDSDNAAVVNDQEQLDQYKRIFPMIWEHPAVAGVTFWGYVENRMWRKKCFLVRADGTWRPAMIWLADYIKNNPL